VNLERAMRLDSRLDGHIVSGHIDGLAYVSKIEISPKTRNTISKHLRAALRDRPEGIRGDRRHKPHGHRRRCGELSVGIIPTTISDTTLSELKEGDAVNIETDNDRPNTSQNF
jgi:riboflavin synthase